MEVDRKNNTGALLIQYSGELGDTRIQYGGPYVGSTLVMESGDGDMHTFQFSGTISVWQLGENTNADDNIVACPNQAVNVILHQ